MSRGLPVLDKCLSFLFLSTFFLCALTNEALDARVDVKVKDFFDAVPRDFLGAFSDSLEDGKA